jgi:hypothetical protein
VCEAPSLNRLGPHGERRPRSFIASDLARLPAVVEQLVHDRERRNRHVGDMCGVLRRALAGAPSAWSRASLIGASESALQIEGFRFGGFGVTERLSVGVGWRTGAR